MHFGANIHTAALLTGCDLKHGLLWQKLLYCSTVLTLLLYVIAGAHLRVLALSMTVGLVIEPFQRRSSVWQLDKDPS